MKGHQNLSEMQVYACTFEVIINQATMAIKFPCTYTVEIKSMNNKLTMATTKNKVSAVDSVAVFNEVLKFETELLYNPKLKQFVKKDVLILLNLISTRKPDQQKLVGRVVIDLSQSIHSAIYSQPQQYKLEYCSVNANITFSIKFMGKKLSYTMPQNFDRDSFSDFQSFVAGIHKDGGASKQRSFEESEKTVEMPWKAKNNEGFDRNKIIEESHNEDAQSRINTGRTSHKMLGSNQNIPKPSSPPQNQMFNLAKLDSGLDAYAFSNKNSNFIQNSNSPPRSLYADNFPTQQQGSRVKSEGIEKSNVSQKNQNVNQNFQPSILTQPINQYQQILRSSHAQEKRIWDQEKRLLNEQILREKQQNCKQKERNQTLQKKAYQTELKLSNIEGKIENSKRQMAILQRQKDLEIKDLKSKLERAVKQKNEKNQQYELKQAQYREMKERIRNLEGQKKRTQEELNKEQQKMHEKVEVALKRVMSSQELVSKLQKEKKENCDSLLEFEKKNLQLVTQINELKSKLGKINEFQSQINKLKTEKSQNEKMYNQIQQNLKSQFESQKNQLLNQLQNLQNKNQATILKYETKLQDLKNEQNLEVSSLRQKIDELHSLISENQLKYHDLNLKLQKKSQQVTIMNEDFAKKLMESQNQHQKKLQDLLAVSHAQIQNLTLKNGELEKNSCNLSQKLASLEKQLSVKNEELELLNNHLKEQQKFKQYSEKQSKQYVQNLEKQILALSEQLNRRLPQREQLYKALETMKNTMSQMKAYQKGLQEELLNMHQNNLEGAFNQLIQKEKRLTSQFDQFKTSADQTIRQLQSNIQTLNQLLTNRNLQIEKLSTDKNETKEYILNLQTQILKYSEGSEQNLKLNDRLVRMEQQISQLKQENKQKDSEFDALKIVNIQLKEYQIGLEEQILKMNEEMEFAIKNKNTDDPRINYSPQKPVITYDEKQKLHLKIRGLERTLQEKKIYERQLEQKILNDHKLGGNSSREEQLVEKIRDLEQTIKHLKQYQEGLEEKIINDHNQIEYTNHNNELVKKIKGQEETIKHLRQYQVGLEEKILEDHEEILKQNNLINSIKEMEATIKQQKQYQQGLEQKILQDHQIIQKIDISGGLKESIKQVQKRYDHSHEECQKQINDLQYKIQQLEFQLLKVTQQAKDQELLTLQKQIDSKDLYIQELESNLKQNQKQLYDLEERIADLTAYKQENQQKRNEQKMEGDNEIPDTIAFQTVIRIIEAHSAQSEGDAADRVDLLGSNSVEKESIEKSMISQPPSLRQKDELADMSDDMSHKSYSKKKSQDDNSPNKPMIIDQIQQIRPKAKATELQRFKSVDTNKRTASDPLSLFLNKVQPDSSKKIEQNTNKMKDLQNQLKDKQAKIEALSKEAKETQSKALKLESQNKFYQKRIKDLQNQRQAPSQAPTNKNDNYIRSLQKTVEDYENKIKALKSKEIKIQQALVIIQEESYKIVGELSQKEKECEQLKNQILKKNKQIEYLASPSQNLHQIQIVKSSPEDIEQINQLKQLNCELQQQISENMARLSAQENQIKKYEEALGQMSLIQKSKQKLQHENKNNIEKINKLQVELKQVNDQLMTNKRLVGKLRQNKEAKNSTHFASESNNALSQENKNLKKRVQELEEEMFSYQASENQKDIQMQTLRNQVILLQQQIQRGRNINQPQSLNEKSQKIDPLAHTEIKTENQQLKTVIEIIKADNEQLKNKTQQIETIKNQQIDEKKQKIKSLQVQVHKLENLMKTQRLEYFNKRRQFNQQKEQLQNKNHQQQDFLTIKQAENNELKSNLIKKQEQLATLSLRVADAEKQLNQARHDLEIKSQLFEQKKQQLLTKSNLVDLFENRILYLENEISNKDKEIKLLGEEIIDSHNQVDVNQMKEMQNQLNFYSEELALVTKKWEEVQPIYNVQKQKIQNLERVIEELNNQLQLSHQQNQFNQEKLLKNVKIENKQAYDAKVLECNQLKKKLDEISEQFNFVKQNHEAIQKANLEKISELQQKYKIAEAQKQKAVEELEQKQMEHMNTELDLHFKLREKNQKSQLAIGSSLTDNQFKKSLNGSQEVGVGLNDIIPASKILKQLINNRSNRSLAEKQIEVMVIRITQLEEQLYGASAATKEKGLILEKARLLSMEFSKIKVTVMKSKMPSEERMKFLTSLKPFQSSIKDILNLSEIYSENLLSSDLTSQNLSRS